MNDWKRYKNMMKLAIRVNIYCILNKKQWFIDNLGQMFAIV